MRTGRLFLQTMHKFCLFCFRNMLSLVLSGVLPSIFPGLPHPHRRITPGGTVKPSPGLTASMMPVSHGRHHKAMSYESTAFFIGNEYDGRSTLIFGDVEAGESGSFHLSFRGATTMLQPFFLPRGLCQFVFSPLFRQ